MISSIFMSGRLGNKLDDRTRYVEVDRPIPSDRGFVTDRFIVRSHALSRTAFITQPNGAYICFKGRVEQDETLGVIFVLEMEEMYRFPEGTKRI